MDYVPVYATKLTHGLIELKLKEHNLLKNAKRKKMVVACGDFTECGKKLIEFAHLKNTCISSEQSGYGTELSSILQAIDEHSKIMICFFHRLC